MWTLNQWFSAVWGTYQILGGVYTNSSFHKTGQTDRQTEYRLVTTPTTQEPADTTTHEATHWRASRVARSATLRLRAAGRCPAVAPTVRLPLAPAAAAVEARARLAAQTLVALA